MINGNKKFIWPFLKEVSEGVQCEDENGNMKEYWKFKISKTEDLINTNLLNFPLDAVSTQKEYISELQKPIVITIEEIK